jgi:hypothetical protein
VTRIYYRGPLEAVEIAPLGVVVERGKSADVEPDMAEELAKQSDWHIRGAASKEPTKEIE